MFKTSLDWNGKPTAAALALLDWQARTCNGKRVGCFFLG